jgi:hypothetical protein
LEQFESGKLKSLLDRMEHMETTKQKILTDRLDAAEAKLERLGREDNLYNKVL